MKAQLEESETFSDLVRSGKRHGIGLYAMMLESYFDDSSDDKRQKYVAYGGLIGGSHQWDDQLMKWGIATTGLKHPFRSADCETGHGQFEGVDIPTRVARMTRLITVIKDTELRGFASVVPVALYKESFPASDPDGPSLLALRQAIMNMAHIADDLQMDVQIWFEKGSQDGAIQRVFDSIIGHASWKPRKRLRSISFDTKRSVHLQAADLIAREAFKHIDNKGVRPTRKSVARITDRLAFVVWNRETLGFLAQNGGADNLDLLAEWDKLPDAPRFIWHTEAGGKRDTIR